MVIPYGSSSDAQDSNPDPNSDPATIFDRSLKVLAVKDDGGSRRLRREQAMRHSKLAHQYHEAKRDGDYQQLSSSKSLLNLFHSESRKSTISSCIDSDRPRNPPMTMQSIDQIFNNVEVEMNDNNTNDLASNSEESDDEGESILGSSSDEDYFELSITQLDNDTFEEEFSKLIRIKSDNNSEEIAEWNHSLVGVDFRHKLNKLDSHYNPTLQILYAMAESIVSRSYMEDRSYGCAIESSREIEKRSSLAIFGVFDGHSGAYVAQTLQEQYAIHFCKLLKECEDQSTLHPYEHYIAHVFEATNALLDREILLKDYQRQQKNLHAGIQDLQTYAGSVAVVAAIMPAVMPHSSSNYHSNLHDHSESGSKLDCHHQHQQPVNAVHVFISHVGDCRAVLSHDGIAIQLTEDHKANMKTEKQRIENAGGWVHNGRVNGALGVSRSFGDIQFKNFATCHGDESFEDIWGIHQQVISKPDFKHFLLEDSYEFMILASDGLWDVFSCQDAVNFVRKKLFLSMDLQQTTQELISKAIERGTQDNTSAIIIAFHQ